MLRGLLTLAPIRFFEIILQDNMDAICLNNIALFARHGVKSEEQQLGQRFFLDVELYLDLSAAAREDDLAQSIDYEAVYRVAAAAFTAPTCKLVEHAAWQVMKVLFQEFPVQEITVRVRKPFARIDGILDAVEVELSRRREEVLGG